MRRVPRPALPLLLLLVAIPAAAAPPAELVREFRYDASRFSLADGAGQTLVGMAGATREFTPGRPDLPITQEAIELPPGVRVTGLQVTSLATELLRSGVHVPAAIKAKPGLEPIERTPEDPAWYGRAGFPPEASTATLAYEGWMRGKHLALLQVNPVRWDARSGRLERVSRLQVKLTLAPYDDPSVAHRERVVPEWETDRPYPARPANAALAGGRTPQPFKPTQIPSVMGSPVAYVIITTDALVSQFQRLADWKTQAGVPAVVRTLSFIRQEYPFGADDADRMRQFIRDAYTRWGTKWVLLGGDTDVIPYRTIHTTFFGGEDIPCDMYFSCLDGNWNRDGDSIYGEGWNSASAPGDSTDMLPEVYVGRAPVLTSTDVQRFVDKNFQYTRTPVGDYEHMVDFFAEVLFPPDWQPGMSTSLDGAELSEEVLPYLQGIPSIHYLRLYENYTDSRWLPGALQETRQVVLDSLSAGYNMAIHIGHGYRNVMSCGNATIDNSDANALTNGNRLTNLYAIDCTSNAIDFPCIGEAFLNAPNGGAVTNIGSSRFDFPYSGRAFQKEYFRLMFQDSVTAVGEAQARQKIPFASVSANDNINRWTETTLLMLGDPELRQWLGSPRTLTVTHPPTFTLSDTTMTVNVKIGATPLYGARVTIDKDGDDYRSVTTDGAGNAVLDFRPSTTGSFTLTVTGFDCRPVQETMTVSASSGPAVTDLPPVIDDDNVGGTTGNGDGFLDAGETVDMTVPVINRGGSVATLVTGTLSTTDPLVTILVPTASYGTLGGGASATGSPGFRISLPYDAPDQREIPFTLSLLDMLGHHYVQRFTVTSRAPELRQFTHTFDDAAGNNNGIPDAGETVNLSVKLRNLGRGSAGGVTTILRDYDGLATVTDSSAAYVTIGAGQEVQGDPMTFTVGNTAARLELRISDGYGLLGTQTIDLLRPPAPVGLLASGSSSSISLTWTPSPASDLRGYNIYHSVSGGPFTKVNLVPTDRTSYYQDENLLGLTHYSYVVTAVDSSGNESALSASADASTNPPLHAIFPVQMGRTTPANVAVDYVWQSTQMDIVAGSNVLFAWHADGTAPVDADGTSVTYGDFTTRGSYYAAGASLGKIDNHGWSIVAPSWDSLRVYVFDRQGNVRPGWPVVTDQPVWSSVAIGDLNNDGSSELVFGSNGQNFYVFRADGSEWIDGDSNPATKGVFKVIGGCCHYGTPALADLNGDGQLDIIYAAFDGKLYAWRSDGSNLPNFPVNVGASNTGSVAVGYLDGPSDTQLDIVLAAQNDSLYVIKADGGRHAGFPVRVRFGGTSKQPSAALADMDNDGYTDIVVAGTDGKIYVYDHNGTLNPNFTNVRYSNLTDYASESSPVVADINGDGIPDIVMGDENGVLNAISGTGAQLPGFPIQLGGEVRGTPALCDCDRDGKSEIVVTSWDQNTYVWDYDFPFSPSGEPPWPQFHHDARRTGLATNHAFVGVGDPGVPSAPTQIEFAPPAPNPARSSSRISWAVPAERRGADFDLSVYDLAGRHLATLATGSAAPGRHSVDWDLRSSDGARLGGAIYFLRLRLGATVMSRKLVVMP